MQWQRLRARGARRHQDVGQRLVGASTFAGSRLLQALQRQFMVSARPVVVPPSGNLWPVQSGRRHAVADVFNPFADVGRRAAIRAAWAGARGASISSRTGPLQ